MENNQNLTPYTVLMMPDYRQGNPYQSLLANALQKCATNVRFFQGYRRVFPIFRTITASQESIDILHLNWLEVYLKGDNKLAYLIYNIKFLIDIFLVRLSGVKIVWTIHDEVEHDSIWPALELWTRHQLIQLTHRLILHNQASLDLLTKNYEFHLRQAEVIPHGHYRDVYGIAVNCSDARQQLQLPLQGKIYMSLGMLKPYKGLETLIEAWQEHTQFYKDSFLLIAGQPINTEYSQLIEQKAAQVTNIIFRPGYVDEREIPLFFGAVDVVVLPYKRILTSGSLLLAASYGKPIIAPRIGSIPEVLSSADDLLYEQEDPDGLFKALQKSQKSNLQELGQRIATCCDRLDWSRISEKTRQTYSACFAR